MCCVCSHHKGLSSSRCVSGLDMFPQVHRAEAGTFRGRGEHFVLMFFAVSFFINLHLDILQAYSIISNKFDSFYVSKIETNEGLGLVLKSVPIG